MFLFFAALFSFFLSFHPCRDLPHKSCAIKTAAGGKRRERGEVISSDNQTGQTVLVKKNEGNLLFFPASLKTSFFPDCPFRRVRRHNRDLCFTTCEFSPAITSESSNVPNAQFSSKQCFASLFSFRSSLLDWSFYSIESWNRIPFFFFSRQKHSILIISDITRVCAEIEKQAT
jgi:hypothetical protein